MALLLRVRDGYRGDQRTRVGMTRVVVKLEGGRYLAHIAKVQHHDAGADVAHHAQVMGDEDQGQPHFLLQLHQQVDYLGLDRDIQRRDGFIADDQLRLEDQRAGYADALALSTGKLVRIAVDLVRQQPHAIHHLAHPFRDLGLGRFWEMGDQRLGDDLADGHARIQRSQGILEDHLHIAAQAAQFAGFGLEDVGLAHPQSAAVARRNHADHRPRQGGLAAAGFADHAQRFAGEQVEADAVHGLQLARRGPRHAALPANIETDLQVAYREQGLRVAHRSSSGARRQARRRPSPVCCSSGICRRHASMA